MQISRLPCGRCYAMLGPRVFIASVGFWATTVLCLQVEKQVSEWTLSDFPSSQSTGTFVLNLEINVARLGLLPHRVFSVLGMFLRALHWVLSTDAKWCSSFPITSFSPTTHPAPSCFCLRWMFMLFTPRH